MRWRKHKWPSPSLAEAKEIYESIDQEEYDRANRERVEWASARCAECSHLRVSHNMKMRGYTLVWPECDACHPANLVPYGREIALTHEYVDLVHKARHEFKEHEQVEQSA